MEQKILNVRVEKTLIDQAQNLASDLSKSIGIRVTLSDVVRMALERHLEAKSKTPRSALSGTQGKN